MVGLARRQLPLQLQANYPDNPDNNLQRFFHWISRYHAGRVQHKRQAPALVVPESRNTVEEYILPVFPDTATTQNQNTVEEYILPFPRLG